MQVDARLRAPLLAEDWAAWAEAWRALDAGPLGAAGRRARARRAVTLTLCGERFAQRFEPATAVAAGQRLRPALASTAGPAAVLEAL